MESNGDRKKTLIELLVGHRLGLCFGHVVVVHVVAVVVGVVGDSGAERERSVGRLRRDRRRVRRIRLRRCCRRVDAGRYKQRMRTDHDIHRQRPSLDNKQRDRSSGRRTKRQRVIGVRIDSGRRRRRHGRRRRRVGHGRRRARRRD